MVVKEVNHMPFAVMYICVNGRDQQGSLNLNANRGIDGYGYVYTSGLFY